MISITYDEIRSCYESLLLIRKVEERIIEIYPSDEIKSPVHLSIGQEFISVGVCENLNRDDRVFSNYRGHAAYLAKGGSLRRFFAELFGKKTGCSGGLGGSMHLSASEVNFHVTSAIVASSVPSAVGAAFALKTKGFDDIFVCCFLGDGALGEGSVFESFNLASLYGLQILFVVEDNRWAIHSPQSSRQGFKSVGDYASLFGFRYEHIQSGSLIEVFTTSKKLLTHTADATRPGILHIDCERLYGHVGVEQDWDCAYRSQRDRLYDAEFHLRELEDLMDADVVLALNKSADAKIDEAVLFARESDLPSIQDAFRNVL